MGVTKQAAEKRGHLVLGLLHKPQGQAARAIEAPDALGVRMDRAHEAIVASLGPPVFDEEQPGYNPFTPDSKKVLELAPRQSLTAGHHNEMRIWVCAPIANFLKTPGRHGFCTVRYAALPNAASNS